jgi:hypothetical protein
MGVDVRHGCGCPDKMDFWTVFFTVGCPYWQPWKKAVLPNSNVIISQSVQSAFLKLFVHVLPVVYGKILELKFQKKIFFLFGLPKLQITDLSIFLRKMTFFL